MKINENTMYNINYIISS